MARITTPFGPKSTAAEVAAGIDLPGKRVIITGGASGTGGMKTPPELRKTPQQGAATSVLLATSPLLEGIGGRYFEDCNEVLPEDGSGDLNGVAAYALDPENADRLWEESLRLLGFGGAP
jgi:hypothetical protein